MAFEQWMRRSYWTVAAMYEDRHDLVALAPEGNLVRLSIPAKRTKVQRTLLISHLAYL